MLFMPIQSDTKISEMKTIIFKTPKEDIFSKEKKKSPIITKYSSFLSYLSGQNIKNTLRIFSLK